jgi:hypothetical protein
MGRRLAMALGVSAAVLSMPFASASSVSTSNTFSVPTLMPLFIALCIAFFVRRWFIPQQLKNLQVAFEIDDDLY